MYFWLVLNVTLILLFSYLLLQWKVLFYHLCKKMTFPNVLPLKLLHWLQKCILLLSWLTESQKYFSYWLWNGKGSSASSMHIYSGFIVLHYHSLEYFYTQKIASPPVYLNKFRQTYCQWHTNQSVTLFRGNSMMFYDAMPIFRSRISMFPKQVHPWSSHII